MRLLFISDIHGVPSTLEAALDAAQPLGYDKIVLLGDLLYHGPRNGVPNFYNPVKVAEILNGLKDKIVMFEFPMMSDYAIVESGSETFFLTHGHLWNEWKLPPVGIGTVLAHGHTHVPELKKLDCGMTIFNPGSISLPKGGSSRSFGHFDGEKLSHHVI